MLLADCLYLTPLRMLLAICQANNFACNARAPKADLVATLAQRLAGRARSPYLAQLPAPQREILATLAQQQGQMPLDRFQARFGQIRPYRPWRSDSPAHPWRNPASLPEELSFRGLIFVVKSQGQPASVVLPAEIASLLRPAPAAQPLPPPTLPAASLLLDIALLLAYLQQAEVRPLHGRWLSPRHCRQIGARLAPPVSFDLLHSERQAGRIAFAHYLAEQLQLVTVVAGLLKPSPLAGDWLLREPLELLRACWRSWLAAEDGNRQLWRRFLLPGHDLRDPVGFTRRLIDHLLNAAANFPQPADILAELLPWWENEQDPARVATTIHALAIGPLAWFGVVETPPNPLHADPARIDHALVAWLDNSEDAAPATADGRLHAAPGLGLALPPAAPPPLAAIFHLAPWCELEPGPRLVLTQASLARSLAQGFELPGLYTLWRRFVDSPLDADSLAQVLSWAGSLQWAELQPVLLLRTEPAAVLDQLLHDRAVRPHLGRRLAANLATVRSHDPDRLIRALQARGLVLRQSADSTDAAAQVSKPSPAPGDGWWLYVSALIHRNLASHLGLPMPPGAALAALRAALGPGLLSPPLQPPCLPQPLRRLLPNACEQRKAGQGIQRAAVERIFVQ